MIKLLLFLLAFSAVKAQNYNFKTIDSTQPISGVKYQKIVESTMPWSINVLEIDLTKEDLEIKAVTAFDSVAGNERTSQMIQRQQKNGSNVIAGINADFYEAGGYATNVLVSNGRVVSMPRKNYSVIAFNAANTPFIGKIDVTIGITIKNKSFSIQAINDVREANELILYNEFYGKRTRTNKWGSEALLKTIGTNLLNDTLLCIVDAVNKQKGNSEIKKNYLVLSGHDAGAQIVSALHIGDTLKCIIRINNLPDHIEDIVGGFTQLVTNGGNSALASYDAEGKVENRDRFALFRHPRTAIGFNKNKSILYLVTVDGRQESSAGMTLVELADFMISLGVYQALNLDGGGSTTMVVNDKIVNSPSDPTGERAVSNALLIIKNK